MTANDLLYAIAKRAQVLCDSSSPEVRRIYGTADTPSAAISESHGMSKGEVIEAILTNEFEDEANKIDTEEEGNDH